jgi:hypothetical protein
MMAGGSDVSFFVRIEKNYTKKEQKKKKGTKCKVLYLEHSLSRWQMAATIGTV